MYDFRQHDIKNGGEGAPLSPIYHLVLIKALFNENKVKIPVSTLNIGGIANITKIDKDFKITSRDIGPGNCLVDQWMQSNLNKKYDEGGKISARGKINEIILEQALETHENIFQDKSTRSFDTNDFDISFILSLIHI